MPSKSKVPQSSGLGPTRVQGEQGLRLRRWSVSGLVGKYAGSSGLHLMSTAAFCLCLTVESCYVKLDTLSKWRSHASSALAA